MWLQRGGQQQRVLLFTPTVVLRGPYHHGFHYDLVFLSRDLTGFTGDLPVWQMREREWQVLLHPFLRLTGH